MGKKRFILVSAFLITALTLVGALELSLRQQAGRFMFVPRERLPTVRAGDVL